MRDEFEVCREENRNRMRRSDREVKDFDGIIRIMEKYDVCRIALNITSAVKYLNI